MPDFEIDFETSCFIKVVAGVSTVQVEEAIAD
jgi:hypothetical protein